MSLRELVEDYEAQKVVKIGGNAWIVMSKKGWYIWEKGNDKELKKISVSREIDLLLLRLLYLLSPTLIGIKPSTTVTIINWEGEKGLNLKLWRAYREEIMDQLSLVRYTTLLARPRSELILFYNPRSLEKLLANEEVSYFFSNLGYPVESLNGFLCGLKTKCEKHCTFPPEAGVILGIPLKDVKGFMGISPLKVRMTQGWKMYGDIEESLDLYKIYRNIQGRAIEMIKSMPINKVVESLIKQK